jgi:hypothetical protein
MVAFYLLAPFPTVISRRLSGDSSTNPCREIAIFITSVLIISAFGLPIVLARAPITGPVVRCQDNILYIDSSVIILIIFFLNLKILWGSAGLVITANIIVFLTIMGFFLAFDNDDVDYSMW